MRGALLGTLAFAVALVAALLLFDPTSNDAGAERGIFALRADTDPGAQPTWRLGDAWRVQFGENDPICWLAVARVDDDGYHQGVWCPTDEAPFIATQLATSGAPIAGDMTRELGVRQGEAEPVLWFAWPLEDGKSWSTTWQGAPAHVTATWLDARERYTLELCLDGGSCVATYDYDPALGWWSFLVLDDGFSFQVHERAVGWDRGAVLAEADERSSYFYNGVSVGLADLGGATGGPDPFEVGEEDLVVVELRRQGEYVHEFFLEAPDGSAAFSDSSDSASDRDDHVFGMVDAQPGTWRIHDTAAAPGMLYVHIWAVTLTLA